MWGSNNKPCGAKEHSMLISAHDMIPYGKMLKIKGTVWDAWAVEFGQDTSMPLEAVVERVTSKVGLRAAWALAWELQSRERRRDSLRKMFERLAAIGGPAAELANRAAKAEQESTAFLWAELSVDARQAARQMVAANDRRAAVVWAVVSACHDPVLATARAGITAREYLSEEEGAAEMTSQIMDLIRIRA